MIGPDALPWFKTPLFGKRCATIVQPKIDSRHDGLARRRNSSRSSEETERVAQFLGGGFLIHSDLFALIDSHLFC